MTPKERADSLIALFLKRYEDTDSCFGKCDDPNICDGTGNGCGMWIVYAKDSAIICVEQIIDSLEAFGYTGTFYDHFETSKMVTTEDANPTDYYRAVLEQIKNS